MPKLDIIRLFRFLPIWWYLVVTHYAFNLHFPDYVMRLGIFYMFNSHLLAHFVLVGCLSSNYFIGILLRF